MPSFYRPPKRKKEQMESEEPPIWKLLALGTCFEYTGRDRGRVDSKTKISILSKSSDTVEMSRVYHEYSAVDKTLDAETEHNFTANKKGITIKEISKGEVVTDPVHYAPWINLRDIGSSGTIGRIHTPHWGDIDVKGKEKINGRECFVFKNDLHLPRFTMYYDKLTGLLIRACCKHSLLDTSDYQLTSTNLRGFENYSPE
jgi:hypothetical protein